MEFEGGLARKLRFHLFILLEFEGGLARKLRFHHLQLLKFEGSLALKLAFCYSVSADPGGMAASRFLLAAAACVILLRFAAESRKSHCNGSVRRVKGEKVAIFLIWH